jgi:hypothetical protein
MTTFAAQAIRKALAERYCCEPDDITRSMFEMESVACIVLRVAADQVVPYEDDLPPWAPMNEMIENPIDSIDVYVSHEQRQVIRAKLYEIAAELENPQP